MALPEPSFIDRDANAITADLIAFYETLTGKTLQPAQPEMLLINLIAYRENLLRIAIQGAAKQNLVSYAAFPILDYLGELVGCGRLDAGAARCTLRFTLSEIQADDLVIPAGTAVESKDGKQAFDTDADLTIPAGQLTGDVTATAETAGVAANGYLPGDINSLVAPVAFVAGVASTTMTLGGADIETDDHYRERIKEAPEAFTVAGSRGSYRYHAMSVSSTIIDVTVTSPYPGQVEVYPLTDTGAPGDELLAAVQAALSAETVRPLCDGVAVYAPVRLPFGVSGTVTLYAWADSVSVMAQIQDALEAFAAWLRAGLGRDVTLSRLIALINGVSGVYKVTLNSPATDLVIPPEGWADCTAITITQTGVNNG